MQRLITAFAIILGWVSTAGAVEPGPLTSVRAVQALTNAEVSQGLPVAIEATVNYFRGRELSLFVQDGDAAIFVRDDRNGQGGPGPAGGGKGKTGGAFRPLLLRRGGPRRGPR